MRSLRYIVTCTRIRAWSHWDASNACTSKRVYLHIVHGPDMVYRAPRPPPPGQSKTKFFCSFDLPRYQKSMPLKKVGMDYLFWAMFKMAAIEIWLCHNLCSKAVRVTILVFIHIFLRLMNLIMQIKNNYVLQIIYKQLFERIFRAFSVIFCVSPWAGEGYYAPTTHESLRPSFRMGW